MGPKLITKRWPQGRCDQAVPEARFLGLNSEPLTERLSETTTLRNSFRRTLRHTDAAARVRPTQSEPMPLTRTEIPILLIKWITSGRRKKSVSTWQPGADSSSSSSGSPRITRQKEQEKIVAKLPDFSCDYKENPNDTPGNDGDATVRGIMGAWTVLS